MNTPKETNFYLVSYLPKDITNEAMRLAKQLSERFHTQTFMNQWNPHLTVGSGLFVPENCLNEVVTDLEQIAQTIQPVQVEAKGIGSTDSLNPRIAKNPYVVWIDIILNSGLQNVFDTLETYQKFRKDGYAITRYSPHVTLAYDDLTKENFQGALDFLAWENPRYSFELNNFSMVSFDSTLGRWVEFKRFELGNTKNQ